MEEDLLLRLKSTCQMHFMLEKLYDLRMQSSLVSEFSHSVVSKQPCICSVNFSNFFLNFKINTIRLRAEIGQRKAQMLTFCK